MTIAGEKAKQAEIKDIIDLADYDPDALQNEKDLISMDVRRAAKFNEVAFLNMAKRAFTYQSTMGASKTKREKELHALFAERKGLHKNQKVFFKDNPAADDGVNLQELINSKDAGFPEYVLKSLVEHYFRYTRN